MQTKNLPIRDLTDADELINQRINAIYSNFGGGLGEFFERLKKDRIAEKSEICHTNHRGDVCLGAAIRGEKAGRANI